MLPEFPLLSLFNDPDDCVDDLQELLLEIIRRKQEEELKDKEKDKKDASDDKNQKKRGHERKRSKKINKFHSQASQMIVDASETLLGLVITRGAILGTYRMMG